MFQFFYKNEPEVRRLSPDYALQVVDLLQLGCKKKMILDKIEHDTGKIVEMKDLHNLKQKHAKAKNAHSFSEALTIFKENGIYFKKIFKLRKIKNLASRGEHIFYNNYFCTMNVKRHLF